MAGGKSPVEWALTPIRKYAQFSGRAPRAEYWWYTLAIIVVAVVISVVEGTLGLSGMIGPYGPLSVLFVVALFVPGIAVTVRRLHDTDRSGWWILIALIPYCIMGFMMGTSAASGGATGLASLGLVSIVTLIGGIVILIFMILPGNKGDNRFGPDPYGSDVEQVFA